MRDLIDSKNIFWLYHFLGWAFVWLTNVYFIFNNDQLNTDRVLWVSLMIFFGFNISLFLRYFYKKIDYQNYSVALLFWKVFLYSILGASLWYLLNILSHNYLKWFDSPDRNISLYSYLSYIFYQGILLFAYSGLYFSIKMYNNWTVQKDKTDKALLLAQNAQLELLRNQLNPHFLFNSLSSLRALIRQDNKNAELMVTKISEFLKYSLTENNNNEVRLADEIKMINYYLDIEKIRFGDKLKVYYDIDQLAEDYPIPTFILHPIIENAVKHGFNYTENLLEIKISAEIRNEKELLVIVKNNGELNMKISKDNGTKTGLRNVRQRLKVIYENNFDLDIKEKNKCVIVTLLIRK